LDTDKDRRKTTPRHRKPRGEDWDKSSLTALRRN
jgi:hypothetical protein